MKDFIIEFNDLTPTAQREFLEFMGLDEDELAYGPIAIISMETDEN